MILEEHPVPIGEAGHLPAFALVGQSPGYHAVYGMATKGSHGVVLETAVLGGKMYTSNAAVMRYAEAAGKARVEGLQEKHRTGAAQARNVVAMMRKDAPASARGRRKETSAEFLDRMGVKGMGDSARRTERKEAR